MLSKSNGAFFELDKMSARGTQITVADCTFWYFAKRCILTGMVPHRRADLRNRDRPIGFESSAYSASSITSIAETVALFAMGSKVIFSFP